MNVVGVLLKKDLTEKFSGLKGKKKDIGGILMNIILTALIVGVFIAVLSYFSKTYVEVKIGYVSNKTERLYEILTLFYTILFVLLTIVGIAKLNRNLIEVSNMTLLSMPITPFQIYISKMFGVFIDLFATALVVSVPLFILFTIWNLLAWHTVFLAILFSFIMPMLALCVSSIFTVPYFYLKKWLNKHFIIQLVLYIILTVCAFILYSFFLNAVKSLLESGQISFVFNELNVSMIGKLCTFLIPGNLFAGIVIGKSVLTKALLIVASLVVSIIICLFISQSIFSLVRQNRIGRRDEFIVIKSARNKRKLMPTLMGKEFINVLRTPSYAFNYFAVVISLPLMVVVTASLMRSLMNELIMLNCDFEIVLCAMCMYSVLLNSFCANNISRDGRFFNLMKTFPVKPKTVILSKILFCGITSVVSIFVTTVAIIVLNYLSVWNAVAVFVICVILNCGVICLATRKDLNTAVNLEDNENKTSTNFLIFWGLVLSAGITVVSLLLSIYLQTKFSLQTSNIITCVVLLVFSTLVFVLSLIYLLRKLDKKYKELIL